MEITHSPILQGMAWFLVNHGLLEQDQVLNLQKISNEHHVTLLSYIVTQNILPASLISMTLSEQFNLPIIDLDHIDFNLIPQSLLNATLMQRHRAVPIFVKLNQLFVVTDDPINNQIIQDLQFQTNLPVNLLIAETHKLNRLINKLLQQQEHQKLIDYVDKFPVEHTETEFNSQNHQDDAPVVNYIQRILQEAIKQRVSDIHFEPYEFNYRVRYRQDGLLNTVSTPPIHLGQRIAARLKILSKLDIAEKRLPQDGCFTFNSTNFSPVDCRVSICPTLAGEKIVLRILDSAANQPSIHALGFSDTQTLLLLQAIRRPEGLILITGPTGSGKTLTLYSMLSELNNGTNNISTVEDPIEIKMSGINQVMLNHKIGLTFTNVLRTLLRQDPDIIMIGEIRDHDTATMAIHASQTGHLVLSTLHTIDAMSALIRLNHLGISAFHLANSIHYIVAQRLVRRLCASCKCLNQDITITQLTQLGFSTQSALNAKIYKAIGCNQCLHGYAGRIGIFETAIITKEMRQLIMSGSNLIHLTTLATQQGMQTLLQSGLECIQNGITSIEEIQRVLTS